MNSEVKKLAPAIWSTIKNSRRVLLIFHPSPDPDSVGSNLACCHLLSGLGKEVTMLKGDSPPPEYLSHLPGYDQIVMKNYSEIEPADYDLFLILDIAAKDRISGLAEVEFPSGMKTVLIDHHPTTKPFAELNLITPDYPATAQILFDLFNLWEVKISPAMAACLFVGLYADTGGLKYPNTTPESFLAAGALARLAPNFPRLVFEYENNNSPEQMRFEGLALSSIEVVAGRAALIAISLETLAKHNLTPDDTRGTGLASHLRSVKGWEVSATLMEREPGVVYVSLRTRDGDKYDVSKLASAFGGGGHRAAAGAVIKKPFEEAKALFLEKLSEVFGLK